MDLVTGAVGSLIPKLGDMLKAEYDLQKGVSEQIRSLIQELECAHAALREVAEVAPDQLHPQVRIWARHVREASYDMEDILDAFHIRIQGCSQPADKKSLLKRLVEKMTELFRKSKSRHEVAGAIEEVKKRLQEVTDRRNRFTISTIVAKPVTPSTIDPRLVAMYKETQLVGISESRGDLISMLSSKESDGPNKKLNIVSIVGVGGLGKTTLAKASYENLKSRYDCSGFVSVGRNPDLISVFKNILFDLDRNKYNEIHNTSRGQDLLIKELHEFLGNKRFFIVIDDLWETWSWETIELALVDNNTGSTVITTTRKFEVAIKAGEVYELQPLSDDNAKTLFYTRIFGGEDKCCDSELDEVSDKFLKKCGGVPLAVITMASLLVGKSREEWFEVQNTIGFRDRDNKQVDDTMWIVSLSYYDLPSYLKTCLLYLSVFPEDYFIEKSSLIWKWIAEGFIEKRQGVRLFELGEEYFHDLINRSMIQAAVSKEDGGVIFGCCVHDMVLDLICSLSSKENFVTITSNKEGTLSGSSGARRLVYQNRTVEQTDQDNHKSMRSFISFGCTMGKSVSISSFTVLRVLALERCRLVEEGCLPLNHLKSLLHLRYLGLRNSRIHELPVEIGALKLLKVLDLEGTDVSKLPSSVSLLTGLICLRAYGAVVLGGVIEKLASLEELMVRPHSDAKSKVQFTKELGNLSELRVLKIMIPGSINESLQSDLLQSVHKLHKLQHLQLDGWIPRGESNEAVWEAAVLPRSLRNLITFGIVFPMLPPCISASRLPSLSRMELTVWSIDEQGLEILGRMPELCHLQLTTFCTVTLTNVSAKGCFKKLMSFFYSSMVQFVLNDDSSDVSFTLWYKDDDVKLGSGERKIDCSREAPAVMYNLQHIRFGVKVRQLMRDNNNGSCDSLGLEYIPSLQKVEVTLNRFGALFDQVEKVEASLKRAIDVHPNRPMLQIYYFGK